eukprot:1463965-Prymnesium_polylepis.1
MRRSPRLARPADVVCRARPCLPIRPHCPSIKLSRRGTFANPSRIAARTANLRELVRMRANARESANLSRICESVANL